MSLIIMPTKKVHQVLYIDQEVIGGDAAEFSKVVNEQLIAGWNMDGKPFARGNFLVQPMSRVCELPATNEAN